MPEERRLAAIMFSDIVGYTALMGKNSVKALELLHKNREIQKPLIEKHGGIWLKEMGDGILAQFNTAIDSVRCALEIQKKARKELDLKVRIGIHLGDITIENGDVFGDGVNIASRLQTITDPGGIYISDSIQQAIRGNTDIKVEYLGAVQLKNVDYRINTYYLIDEGLPVPSRKKRIELAGEKYKSVFKSVYTYVATILIIIISIIGLWIKYNTDQRINSIAVLPPENFSEGIDQEWLEAGIHHALIDELSKIHALNIRSRTSSMKYKDSNKAIPEIAQELKVDGILEPFFSISGENVNIQVRLFTARRKEKLIWRQDFNRKMEDILYIYRDVAKSIADVTNIKLSNLEETNLSVSAREVNPKAYEAYVRGMGHVENATKADLERAINYFQLALEIDSAYAIAYYGLALAWGSFGQHGYLPKSEVRSKFQEALKSALELDSTLFQLRWLRAVNYTYNGDSVNANLEFRKAFDINPFDAITLVYYANHLAIIGHPIQGLKYSYRADSLEPFNDLVKCIHAQNLKNARKYDEALEVLLNLLKTEPELAIGLPALWAVYHEKGKFEEAIEVAKRIYTIRNNNTAIEALESGYKEGGYKMAMQRTAEKMIVYKDTAYFPPWQVFTLYARAELKEEALDWLEKAYEDHDGNVVYISIDPLFDYLREEPRFKDILHKMNLPEIKLPLN